MKQVVVPAGIGDNIWILMKLINAEEEFCFNLPNSHPQRGKQIFDLLPQIGIAQYRSNIPFALIKRNNSERAFRVWRNIQKLNHITLEANTHLEEGKRIESWLPDLNVTFKIDWQTSEDDKENVATGFNNTTKYIGIYCSAYNTQRSWGFWDENKWLQLIKLCGKDYTYVIIGAQWDIDLGRNLVKLLKREKIKYIDTIGKGLGEVVEIMKILHYFFSFPSGLGILATTVNCPVAMFYPKHLTHMINAWASHADIETGAYKGCLFCEPDEIYKWCKEKKFV